MILSIIPSCGSDSSDSGKKEYVKDSEVSKVFKSPDEYEGKYIKLGGKVFNTDRDGDTLALQCWHDVENSEEDFIAYMNSEEKFSSDDFVMVEGKIEGEYEGENAFGGEVTCLEISADKMTKSTYQEVAAPTLETKEVNKKQTQGDVTLKITKVEYAEKETRIYVVVNNKSKYDADVFTSSAIVVQDGKQFEADSNYEADYPDVGEIAAGVRKEGIICVKPIDPEKKAKLKVGGYSENYDIDFNDFEITF